jgi:hypothetical protein
MNAITAHLVAIGKAFKRMKSKNRNAESHVAAERASLLFLKLNM